MVWVHQTELFERAAGSATTRPPYEGVLDWYPDFKPLPHSSLKPASAGAAPFQRSISTFYYKVVAETFPRARRATRCRRGKSLRHAVQLASSSSARVICSDQTRLRAAQKVDALVASPGLGARSIDGLNDTLSTRNAVKSSSYTRRGSAPTSPTTLGR